MSYNNLVNSITNTNQILPKTEIFDEPKNILTREEKLDAFLDQLD